MTQRFAGHRVLVTGAAAGIGAAIAARFIAEGAQVVAVDLDAEALDDQARQLGPSFCGVVADVSKTGDAARIAEAAVGPDGALDVLVNNAAVFLLAGLGATDEQWDRTLAVNLLAPARLVASLAPALERSGRGAVVNVASITGHVSQSDRWTYDSSKGGLLALTRCQALDLGPRGIRVNSVSPGYVWTDVLARAADPEPEKWAATWGSYNPLGRVGQPAEVAAAVAFLASSDASYVNATDLRVDGGQLSTDSRGRTATGFGS